MNLEWGGKQSILRSSKLTEKCLGGIMEYEAITKDKNAIIYKRMSVGEIQHTVFKEGDLPPYFFPDQPQFDTLVSIPRKRKASEQASEIFDKKIIKGYVNEPKGIK